METLYCRRIRMAQKLFLLRPWKTADRREVHQFPSVENWGNLPSVPGLPCSPVSGFRLGITDRIIATGGNLPSKLYFGVKPAPKD